MSHIGSYPVVAVHACKPSKMGMLAGQIAIFASSEKPFLLMLSEKPIGEIIIISWFGTEYVESTQKTKE
jgi:hypothetical protein